MSSLSIQQRLEMLADSAKYDVSCSSGGTTRKGESGRLGNTKGAGICHTFTSDGRCISLLKLLLTNSCIYDCAYCVNRRSNPVRRTSLSPKEVVDLTMDFYRRNYIEGLFLSTGIVRSADHTMEQLIQVARTLREQERYNGYIHLKVVPGADPLLIKQAGRYADRISVNIELPSQKSLNLLAPDKPKDALLRPMKQMSSLIHVAKEERKLSRRAPVFAPAGQSTQLIVGATPESDRQIITLSEALYQKMSLRRVYYSAFVPVSSDSRLPVLSASPLLREHRLYQADWLLRFYGFGAQELLDDGHPNFDMRLDPKSDWALRHLEQFPLEVNQADYEMLLRVPGIGVRSAQRIVRSRRAGTLGQDELKRLGVVLKRAKHFLTAGGRYLGGGRLDSVTVFRSLTGTKEPERGAVQLPLFSPEVYRSAVTGEL